MLSTAAAALPAAASLALVGCSLQHGDLGSAELPAGALAACLTHLALSNCQLRGLSATVGRLRALQRCVCVCVCVCVRASRTTPRLPPTPTRP